MKAEKKTEAKLKTEVVVAVDMVSGVCDKIATTPFTNEAGVKYSRCGLSTGFRSPEGVLFRLQQLADTLQLDRRAVAEAVAQVAQAEGYVLTNARYRVKEASDNLANIEAGICDKGKVDLYISTGLAVAGKGKAGRGGKNFAKLSVEFLDSLGIDTDIVQAGSIDLE